MDQESLVALLRNPDFRNSLQSIFAKSTLENISYVAVAVSTVASIIALIFVSIRLKHQIRDSRDANSSIQKQIDLLRSQIKEDHERARREVALDLLKMWSLNLHHESQSTRRFVEPLGEEQCRKLIRYEPFAVEKEKIPALLSCLQHSFSNVTENDLFDNGLLKQRYLTGVSSPLRSTRKTDT